MLLSHLKKIDWVLVGSAIILSGIGLLSLYSISAGRGDFLNFHKQAIFLVIGVFLMLLFSFFDYRNFKNNSYLILVSYFACILLLAGLFFFGESIRGVRRWYDLGPVSLSPVELVKIVLILLLAKYFSLRHVEMYRFFHIIISGIYVIIPAALVHFQPDLGSALALLFLWLGVLLVSGIKVKHFFILLLCAVLLGAFSWSFLLKDYQKERITSFAVADYKPLEVGWNQRQAKIAIGSGGLWGQGFGKGSQAQYGFLPEARTDFMFSAIAEEFGLLSICGILLLFSLFFWRLTRIAFLAKDNFSRLFVLGLEIMLIIQVFINLGSNLGFLPVIGTPLPFLGYGGSFLIMIFIGLGIAQNIRINNF
jgi:rod shape determining protein RodA